MADRNQSPICTFYHLPLIVFSLQTGRVGGFVFFNQNSWRASELIRFDSAAGGHFRAPRKTIRSDRALGRMMDRLADLMNPPVLWPSSDQSTSTFGLNAEYPHDGP
jgi:hypothetical protein